MLLLQFVTIFLLDVTLLLYTLLILKSSQFLFKFKKKKYDQVYKLVRPWTSSGRPES